MTIGLSKDFGATIEKFLSDKEFKTWTEAFEFVSGWKKSDNTMKNFRTAEYDRFIFKNDRIIVDFGSHYWFIVVLFSDDLERESVESEIFGSR